MKHILLVTLLVLVLPPQAVYAETLSGNAFQIQLGATKTPKRLNEPRLVTPTPTPPPPKPPKPLVHTFGSLDVRLTENVIDFGLLESATPVKRSTTLSVSSPTGAAVSVYESERLAQDDGTTIPDTSCDGGECRSTHVGIWKSPLTFGFGYSLEGDHYKPFGKPQEKPVLLLETSPYEKSSLDMVLKTNVAAGQADGNYANTITLLILPKL